MRKSPGVEASPTGSRKEPLLDPIQFILQDHDRQLEICSGLEKLISASEAEPIAEWAVSLLSFLTRDLPLHVKDEELDLFPRLTSRRPPESNLGDILDQLVTEHETDKGLADLVIKDLRAIAEGGPPEYPIRFQMNVRAFCEMQRRHLNWENRVVLPLALTLLTEEDKQDLAHRMAARRSSPEPT
jgi:hemerythrin-like domain-containing protein